MKKSMSKTAQIAYSLGAFGHDAFFALLSGYLIMFITSHLFSTGNSATNAKMISLITMTIMLLRIAELFIDPFIGNAIDRTKTRWGHFRPWVVVGGTVSSLILLTLFTNLGGLSQQNPLLYVVVFGVLYILMDVFYSFKDVGFWSMLPSLTTNSREREKTASYARIGSTVGQGLVGVLVMPAVIFFSSTKSSTGDNQGWFIFALIVCMTALLTAWGVAIFTREKQSKLRKNKKDTKGIIGIFKALSGNDQLMWVAFAYLFYCTAIYLTNALEVYYFTYIMGMPKAFSIFSTINIFLGIISTSIFPIISKKVTRRFLFTCALGLMIAGLILFAFSESNLALVLLAASMFGFPQQIVFLIVLMVMTDSVEYGQLKLGHRDESLALSVRPLVDKFGGALSNGVVGQIAIIAGMTTGATASTITSAGRLNFKLLMFGVPIILLLISIIVYRSKVILSEQKHAEIVTKLEQSWGKKFNHNLNKSAHQVTVASPIAGKLVDLKHVSDPAFASGSLGQGFAIKPSDGKVYAPFDATVKELFSTRHAIGLVTDSGLAILIHIGVGTVSLKGTGFVSYVQVGQKVKAGDEILEFWDPTIKKAGLDDIVMIAFTNIKEFKQFDLLEKTGSQLESGQDILKVTF